MSLSIDGGVKRIEISIISEKKEIIRFLKELHGILYDRNFDVDKNIIIIKKQKSELRYSTPFTLIDLDYDNEDVVECLKLLNIKEYSETLFDKNDDKPPLLYVFGTEISNRLVYIKLKIKGETGKKILCVSFHYAKRKMEFPYA